MAARHQASSRASSAWVAGRDSAVAWILLGVSGRDPAVAASLRRVRIRNRRRRIKFNCRKFVAVVSVVPMEPRSDGNSASRKGPGLLHNVAMLTLTVSLVRAADSGEIRSSVSVGLTDLSPWGFWTRCEYTAVKFGFSKAPRRDNVSAATWHLSRPVKQRSHIDASATLDFSCEGPPVGSYAAVRDC